MNSDPADGAPRASCCAVAGQQTEPTDMELRFVRFNRPEPEIGHTGLQQFISGTWRDVPIVTAAELGMWLHY